MIMPPTNLDEAPLPRMKAPSGTPRFEMKPEMAASIAAFRAALPGLLKTRSEPIQWVAFASDKMIAIGRTKTELARICLDHGLERGTFVVRLITPESSDELELPNDL